MSDGNWDNVLVDYQQAQKQSWGEDLIWMEKLVSHLLANRDVSKFYPITSHYILSFFIGEKFDEVYEKTIISIQLSHEPREKIKAQYRYKFSLTNSKKDEEIIRQYVESVFCSFEKSLEVFDEMFEKLKAFS